jgi:hypothetical protein
VAFFFTFIGEALSRASPHHRTATHHPRKPKPRRSASMSGKRQADKQITSLDYDPDAELGDEPSGTWQKADEVRPPSSLASM